MVKNIPQIKMGIIPVSRDCFDITLSDRRCNAIVEACKGMELPLFRTKTVVESEADMRGALDEAAAAGCNALTVFLGNFGPETPETLITRYFSGPVMYVAAAEERKDDLMDRRGDAYCGMLNCSYNLGLRHLKAVIPENPVGSAAEIAEMIGDFVPVARALLGLSSLKVITFGPRPQDFFACNAPIKGLYDLGVEVQENSELDLLAAYKALKEDKRIGGIAKEMAAELGHEGNQYPDLLLKMAQYELTLLDWAQANRGASDFVIFANKCWPAFPKEFGFVPCYVNSRLAARGIPVGCEVDIYGAVSEYVGACITGEAVTILDINNTVPDDLFASEISGRYAYTLRDTFMGFHCGNSPLCMLSKGQVNYMLIQNRLMEDSGEPDFTRGTLEGTIKPGDITFFRLHANPDGGLQAYIAQGEVLPVDPHSFGGIGVFAVTEMARFYRHVLIEKRFPHHGAVVFGHIGRALHTVFSYLGVPNISFNRPKGMPYESEYPF